MADPELTDSTNLRQAPPEKAAEFADAMRQLRTALGDSQEQFAHRMNTSVRTIARWESGRLPSPEALRKLAEIAATRSVQPVAKLFYTMLGHLDIRHYQFFQAVSAMGLWARAMEEIKYTAFARWTEIASTIERSVLEIRDATKDDAVRIGELDQLLSQIRKSRITVLAEFEELVAARMKTIGASRAHATFDVLTQNPELYARLRQERAEMVHPMRNTE